jgi:hypothetical protein
MPLPSSVFRQFLLFFLLAIAGTSVAACSNGTGSASGCTAGRTVPCTCASGGSGLQTCLAAGTAYGECVCSTDAGSACPDGRPACAGSCCNSASRCVNDGTGTLSCNQTCTASSSCPAGKGCCTLLADGTGACFANDTVKGQQCLCATGSDCASGACGESTDRSGNPTGHLVCVAIDGQPYHGCQSSVPCLDGYCCVSIEGTSYALCEEPCHTDSNCGPGHCATLSSGTCAGAPGVCQ